VAALLFVLLESPSVTLRRGWPWATAAFLTLVSFFWLLTGQVQSARDLYAQFFPETYVLIERWRALEVPLWLPNERLGQPFLALLYTQALYPPRVLTGLLFGHVVGPNVMHVLHVGWAFAGMFFAVRRLGASRAGAVVSAAGWAFSPFFVELSQNLAYSATASWAGWALWACDAVVRSPTWRRVAVLAAVQAATFHAGAPEMWVWQAVMVSLVAASARAPRRAVAWCVVAVVWAACGFAVVALPAGELALEWTDPRAPAEGLTAWSMSWQQLVSIAVPDADFPRALPFFGADQRFFFTLLLGPGVVLLAAVGCRRRRLRPVVVLGMVCGVLALGAHLLPATWLLSLPPFRFFRFPVKYGVGLLFALGVLAGPGLKRLTALHRRGASGPWLSGTVGVAVGLVLASKLFDDVREGFVRGAGWVALSAVVFVLLWQLRRREGWVVGWLLLEAQVMPRRHWPPAPAGRFFTPSSIAATIRSEPHGRVSVRVDVDDPGTPWCFTEDENDEAERVVLDSRQRLSVLRYLEEGLRATGGYGFRDPWRLARAFQQGQGAFQLAGVTHLVRPAGQPLSFQGPSPSRTAIDDLWLWRSADAFPRGWVVHQTTVVADDEAFGLVRRRERLSSRAPIASGPTLDDDVPVGCRSTVDTTELRAEHVRQQAFSCARGVVVLADAWFPGWQVSVDGVRADPLRTYGFLRGVEVSAGTHQIDWAYHPLTFRVGLWLSAGAWLAMVVVLLKTRGKPR